MTLATEILAAMPPDGATLGSLAAALGVEMRFVRKNADRLDADGLATLVYRRGERALSLVPPGTCLACPICRNEVIRKHKSKRLTCSRACAVALSWRDPAKAVKRLAGIRAAKATPEASRKATEANQRRWARPGEREKLAEESRQRWASDKGVEMAIAIRASHRRPEQRAMFSRLRKRFWDNPEGRAKMVAGIRKSKQSPEARAKFSQLLKERWKDPVMREKYTLANRARNTARFGKKRIEP